MLKHKFITLFVSGFFSLLFFCNVSAVVAPQIYVTDLKLDKINFKAGEEINGSATFWNYEKFSLPDVTFNISLLNTDDKGNETTILDLKKEEKLFTLIPDQKATKDFNYQIPDNIPSGKYLLRIQSTNGRGENAGWKDGSILVNGGNNTFLEITDNWMINKADDTLFKDGKASPLVGVIYKSNESPEIQFSIKGSSLTTVVYPEVKVFKRNAEGEIVKTEKLKEFEVGANEKVIKKFTLPGLTDPESYLAKVRLVNSLNDKPVSNIVFFRWVIGSSELSAKIVSVSLDKNVYSAGETASARITYTGPFDLKEDDKNATLGVRLFDSANNLIGEKTEDIDLKNTESIVNIPVKTSVENPRIEVKIARNNKLLDEYSAKLNVPVIKPPQIFGDRSQIIIWTVIGILILLCVGFGFYLIKNKYMKKTLLFLFVFGAVSLFNLIPQKALALTEVINSCNTWSQVSLLMNSPLPLQTVSPSSSIHFSGSLGTYSCNNTFAFPAVMKVYLTEDRDLPIKECSGSGTTNRCVWAGGSGTTTNANACVGDYCNTLMYAGFRELANYGINTANKCKEFTSYLTENYYTAATYNTHFMFWDEIKRIDQTKGYKIVQLGEFLQQTQPGPTLPGQTMPTNPVFDFNYNFPGFIDFPSGKARIYFEVAYPNFHYNPDGTIGFFFWDWLIAYQPIMIDNNAPPIANIVCSPSGCSAPRNGSLTLMNNSSDPDGTSDIVKSVWSYKKGSDPDTPLSYTIVPYNPSCPMGPCLPPTGPEAGIWSFDFPTTLAMGDYTVKLQVYDSKSNTNETKKNVTITSPNSAPTVSNLSTNFTYCDVGANKGQVNFSWRYDDPDNNPATNFNIQVSTNSTFTANVIDYQGMALADSGENEYKTFEIASSPTGNQLAFNRTYYWRVRQQDSGLWSSFVTGSSFTTSANPYPVVNFSTSPTSGITTNDTVTFTNGTTCYSSGACTYSWTMPDGVYQSSTSSTSINPKVKFSSTGLKLTTLRATDSNGHYCDKLISTFINAAPGSNPPTASISCSPSSCSVAKDASLSLINNSTDVDGDIVSSAWSIKQQGQPDSSYVNQPFCPMGPCLPEPAIRDLWVPTNVAGNFTARLIVTDALGNKSTATKNYTVTGSGVNQAPTVSAVSSSQDYCDIGSNLGKANFRWTYNDADGNPQARYNIEVSTNSSFVGTAISYSLDTSVAPSTVETKYFDIVPTVHAGPGIYELEFNRTYYWRVRVQDSQGAWSNYSNGSTFTTPASAYPVSNFSWSPASITTSTTVFFTNSTTCYSSGACTYSWTIPNGVYQSSTSSTSTNPQVKFSSSGTKSVVLRATDSNGHYCDKTSGISVSSATETHKACVTSGSLSYCQSVSGAGADTCATDASCRTNSPIATFSCSPTGCSVVTGNTLTLVNNSTDADGAADIYSSRWSIKTQGAADSTYVLKQTYSGVQNYVPTSDGVGIGNYTARLVIMDRENNTSSAYKDFSITSGSASSSVSANFICDPVSCSVEKGASLNLINKSTVTGATMNESNWLITNNATSATVGFTSWAGLHDYTPSTNTEGSFTARLEATNSKGDADTYSKVFTVTAPSTPPPPPPATVSANITCSPSSCSAFQGETLNLLNSSTSNPSGNVGTSEWYFRSVAGSYPGTANVICATPCDSVPQNFVSGTGNFEAKLVVKDKTNTNTSTATKAFTVKAPATVDFACKVDAGPWVACSTIKQLVAGQTILFTDNCVTTGTTRCSVASTGGTLSDRSWEIKGIAKAGTGTNKTILSYTASETEVGNFSIKMTVSDSAQGVKSKIYDLKLIPPPEWIEI